MDSSRTSQNGWPIAEGSLDEKTAEITRRAWRELGFWYDCDVDGKRWVFRADRKGVAAFAAEVRRFLDSAECNEVGEHAHLGPFSNLRLIRAEAPAVGWRGIAGRRENFEELARELDQLAGDSVAGNHSLAAGLANGDSYRLVLVLEEDGFDPATADRGMPSDSGST